MVSKNAFVMTVCFCMSIIIKLCPIKKVNCREKAREKDESLFRAASQNPPLFKFATISICSTDIANSRETFIHADRGRGSAPVSAMYPGWQHLAHKIRTVDLKRFGRGEASLASGICVRYLLLARIS